MPRKALLLLSLGGLLLTLGCGRDTDPPPRMVGGDAGSLAPVTMAGQTFDKSIAASAQPLPELESKDGAAAADTPPVEKPADENAAEEPKPADGADAPANTPEEPAAEPKPAEPETNAEPAQPKEETAT